MSDNNATIIIHKDPGDISSARDIINVESGRYLIDYIEEAYPKSDESDAPFNGIETSVYLGSIDENSELEGEDFAKVLEPGQIMHIVHRPQGLDPITVAIILVIAAIAVVVLTPTPSLPPGGQQKSSSNNSLTGQTNLARAFQAIPENFGDPLSFPDLLQPSIFEYVGNIKQVREVFSVGVGEYDIPEVRTGDTDLDDVPGSSFTKYEPFTAPSDLQIGLGNNEINGQELLAPNDPTVQATARCDFLDDSGGSGDQIIRFFNDLVYENLSLGITNQFTIAGTASNDGTYTFTSHVVETFMSNQVTKFVVTTTLTDEDVTPTVMRRTDVDPDDWIGWFQMNGSLEEIWSHYQMPRGIRNEEGDYIVVDFELEYQETDSGGTPTGSIIPVALSFAGNTLNAQFKTEKVTPSPSGFYRVRSRRTTNAFASGSSDQLKWEDAVAITGYSGAAFGDITVLDVNTTATQFALSQSERKINCNPLRKLNTWTLAGGLSASKSGTSKFADAILYQLNIAGQRSLDEIDLESLYDIQDNLSDPLLGEFSYSLDDSSISLGTRVALIANAARVRVYRDGQVWRFTRNEAKTATSLFNRRNIASISRQSQSLSLQTPLGFDSVRLEYIDPASEKRAVVLIKIDAGTGTFIEGEVGSRPKKINLSGCRNSLQARDRAHMEVRTILYIRKSVKETVLGDGQLVDLGDRVGWADIYDGDISEGEILEINGNIYTTSEKVNLGVDYFALVTDSNGNISGPVAVTAVSGEEFKFQADFASSPIIADGITIQAGSKYLIGDTLDVSEADFTLLKKAPKANGTVEIELSRYDANIYEQDGIL